MEDFFVAEIIVMAQSDANLQQGLVQSNMSNELFGTQNFFSQPDTRCYVAHTEEKKRPLSDCLICQEAVGTESPVGIVRLFCCGVTMHTSCFGGMLPPLCLGANGTVSCPNCRSSIDKGVLGKIGFMLSPSNLVCMHARYTALRTMLQHKFSTVGEMATLYSKTKGLKPTDGLVYNVCLFAIDRACNDRLSMARMFVGRRHGDGYSKRRIDTALAGHVDFLIKCRNNL